MCLKSCVSLAFVNCFLLILRDQMLFVWKNKKFKKKKKKEMEKEKENNTISQILILNFCIIWEHCCTDSSNDVGCVYASQSQCQVHIILISRKHGNLKIFIFLSIIFLKAFHAQIIWESIMYISIGMEHAQEFKC